MRKLITLFACLAVVANAFSQMTVGPKVGLNLSNLRWSQGEYGKMVNAQDPNYKMNLAWQVGGVVNFQFSEPVSLRIGLLLNRLSTKTEETYLGITYKEQFGASYLQLPIDVVINLPVGDNSFQIFAGPYVQRGISGKGKFEGIQDEEYDIKFKKIEYNNVDDNSAYLNPLDFGLNFGLGFEISGFVISAQYGLGLSNIISKYKYEEEPPGYERSKINSENWSNITFSVAYMLEYY